MSLAPERVAFKEERSGLINEEVLQGKLSAPSTKGESQIFTDDQIANLTGFFDVLKRIHIRLAIEGYKITPEGIEAPTTRFVDA